MIDCIIEEKRWLDFKEAADSKVDHLFRGHRPLREGLGETVSEKW